MYKRITHKIVEEHFASHEDVKSKWKAPLRFFSNGEQMSSNLPVTFQLATGDSRCGNCLAYNPSTAICSKWVAMVRPEYYCPSWTPI
jgi:hypothetical protein